MSPIIVCGSIVKLAVCYLGTPEAYVWVGFGFDPPDNNDDRVKATREMMATYYGNVPYGMFVGNRREDGAMSPITDVDNDGYYDLNVSSWPPGVYRIGYHGLPGCESPFGLPLGPQRDKDVSWANFKEWPAELIELARPFLHREKNGAGLCFRILVRPDGTAEPFGDVSL